MSLVRGARLQPGAPGISPGAASEAARLRAYRWPVRLESTGLPGIVSGEFAGQHFVFMATVGGGWAVYTGSGAHKVGSASTLPGALDIAVSHVA